MIKRKREEKSETIHLTDNFRITSGNYRLRVWFLGLKIWDDNNELDHKMGPDVVPRPKIVTGFGDK